MAAGRLRERVTLQQVDPSATPNVYNERATAYVNLLANEPAEVFALTGNEFNAAQQIQAATTHRVTLRTPTQIAIRPEYRFVWVETLIGGTDVTHYLDIKQIVPLQTRRGYTQCLCTEHVGG
jgi:head-tail adaptor